MSLALIWNRFCPRPLRSHLLVLLFDRVEVHLRRRGFSLPFDAVLGRMRQTLQGSFSAVSKRNFASKYAFESSRRDLHNALLCAALKPHFLCQNLPEFCQYGSPRRAEKIQPRQTSGAGPAELLLNFNFHKNKKIADSSNRFFAKILRSQRCKRMQIL